MRRSIGENITIGLMTAGLLAGCSSSAEPQDSHASEAAGGVVTLPNETAPSEEPFVAESIVRAIDPAFAERMRGVTLRDYPGCATVDDLRIVEVPYHNTKDESVMGTLVVNQALAEEVGEIFEQIYETDFRFHLIAPAEKITSLHGDDPAVGVAIDNELMAKNITSGYNCRTLDGEVDKHGRVDATAVDLNPLYNPMIIPNPYKTDAATYEYSPPAAEGIWNMDAALNPEPSMLLSRESAIGSQVIAIFDKYGWRWGGDWNSLFDGQHFDKVVE